ncbi:MAG: hypothetical protein DMF87_22755 [Acidobacteria bacterium]|nr:MAG: hypothetical protein DMF87_22755 [Acidobacteriota bacterium]
MEFTTERQMSSRFLAGTAFGAQLLGGAREQPEQRLQRVGFGFADERDLQDVVIVEQTRRLADRMLFGERIAGDQQRFRRDAEGERRPRRARRDGLAEPPNGGDDRGVLGWIEHPVPGRRRERARERDRLPCQFLGQGRLSHLPVGLSDY